MTATSAKIAIESDLETSTSAASDAHEMRRAPPHIAIADKSASGNGCGRMPKKCRHTHGIVSRETQTKLMVFLKCILRPP
jgi:hypothetical protein